MCAVIGRAAAFGIVAFLLARPQVQAAELDFSVVGPNRKVLPQDFPQGAARATLKAARNEFEAFQVVFASSGAEISDVSVRLARPLSGAGEIPADNVVLYREAYYDVDVPSNAEGSKGRWPDPLIPDVDVYYGEKRNAFPMRVPSGESRVVWVDVLVPIDATTGDYQGELEVRVGEEKVGGIAIDLKVGNFSLPSTATLKSAFALDYAEPCMAHTNTDTCDDKWNEVAALKLRELYVRSALEHRFTIHDAFFQPPTDGSEKPFEQIMLPLFNGTGKARLPGARVTTARLANGDSTSPETFRMWLNYAKANGFGDRLFFYPVDEPEVDGLWGQFEDRADALHSVDPAAKIILTTAMGPARDNGVDGKIDVMVPLINQLEGRPAAETPFSGNQRPTYDAWLQADSSRELWAYQSCVSHGCGDCGTPTESEFYNGWPSRVIDSTAVQNRAFPWLAFIFDFTGELYFNVSEQLSTAWEWNGLCKFSGSGDGTIFYPGRPDIIGGTTDIPIESIRMKMIREGMEDYEYLYLVGLQDQDRALSVARRLFPHAYDTNKPPAAVKAARDELFALLDQWGPSINARGLPGSRAQSRSSAEYKAPLVGSCAVSADGSGSFLLVMLTLLALTDLLRRRRVS